MKMQWKRLISATVCAAGLAQTWAQAPQFVTLDVEWENSVIYFGDVTDVAKFATSPRMIGASIRNFLPAIGIEDIVSVNGKPAKGTVVRNARLALMAPSPPPGQAIANIGREAIVDMRLEILESDGTRVGWAPEAS